jgi:hypothetical protein
VRFEWRTVRMGTFGATHLWTGARCHLRTHDAC